MRSRLNRFSDDQPSTLEDPQATALAETQANIEARLHFLVFHANKINQLLKNEHPTLCIDLTHIETSLTGIQKIEEHLKKVQAAFPDSLYIDPSIRSAINTLNLILLPNVIDANTGISTNLSKQFAQLSLQKRGPFVELTQNGLQFFWDTYEASERFNEILHACGLDVVTQLQTEAPKVEAYANATYVNTISHLSMGKLLEFSQYHPYFLQHAIDDLYKARGLNRAECLSKTASAFRFQSLNSIHVGDASRTPIPNTDKHLLNIDIVPLKNTKSNHAHHIVILFDDSGSMEGTRINAANEAVKQFVNKLPDDTLISLQPFNMPTVLARQSVAEIKKKGIQFIKATGGTPTFEMLWGSASLVKKNPEDIFISNEDLNNTTIVLMTDGEANGSAADIIQSMKTTNMKKSVPNFVINGKPIDIKNSYGTKKYPCQELPVVYPMAIGDSANVKFIEDISQQLHCPYACVSDSSSDQMNKDIQNALDILQKVQGRISKIYVGVSYYNPTTQQSEVLGSELNNLFIGFTRDIQFTIPANAENIKTFISVDNAMLSKYLNPKIANNADLLTKHYEQAFTDIRTQFSATVEPLKDKLSDGDDDFLSFSKFTSHSRLPDFYIPPVAKEMDVTGWEIHLESNREDVPSKYQGKNTIILLPGKHYALAYKQDDFVKGKDNKPLKVKFSGWWSSNAILEAASEKIPELINVFLNYFFAENTLENTNAIINTQIQTCITNTTKQLEALCLLIKASIKNSSALINDIQLFSNAINHPDVTEYNQHYTKTNVGRSRQAAAQYTQHRYLGRQADVKNIMATREEQVFIFMNNGNYDSALELIMNDASILEQQQNNAHHATPLIYALVLLNQFKSSDLDQAAKLRKFILAIMQHPQQKLNITDAAGNTALHRAIWYGEFEIAKQLILLANGNNTLKALKAVRNKNMVGATQGETFLDNLRSAPLNVLSLEQKHELLTLTMEPVKNQQLFDLIEQGKIEGILSAIAADPEELNRHGSPEKGYPTPLFAILYQLVRGDMDPQIQHQWVECFIDILNRYSDKIDLSESNADGNTLLHYAFFHHNQLDIIVRLVEIAKEKNQLEGLLKARNALAGEGHGETVLMNFSKLYEASIKDFIICLPEADRELSSRSSSTPLTALIIAMKDQYAKCQYVCDMVLQCPSALEKTELHHLTTVAEKTKQGYSGYYWLKAAPIPGIIKLIENCANLLTNPDYDQEHSLLNNLQRYLEDFRANKTTLDNTKTLIEKDLSTIGNESKTKTLFKDAVRLLDQHAIFQKVRRPRATLQFVQFGQAATPCTFELLNLIQGFFPRDAKAAMTLTKDGLTITMGKGNANSTAIPKPLSYRANAAQIHYNMEETMVLMECLGAKSAEVIKEAKLLNHPLFDPVGHCFDEQQGINIYCKYPEVTYARLPQDCKDIIKCNAQSNLIVLGYSQAKKSLGIYPSYGMIGVNCTTASGNRRNEVAESLGFKKAFQDSKDNGFFGKAVPTVPDADHSDAFYCRGQLFTQKIVLGQKPQLFTSIENPTKGNDARRDNNDNEICRIS